MKNNQKIIIFFQKILIEWGLKNFREFPWRQSDKNAYFVLISELLLKRTLATTVNKNINLFIKEFPKIEDLANSEEEKIIEIIKPLGLYNQRVKILQKISKQIVTNHNGKIPSDYDNLIELYGIGKYIANALLCFYYKKRVPIVDPNVIRIFIRFFNFKSEKKDILYDPKIWLFAEEILPEKNYITYNYSLLDFGQLVCKARNPSCEECPINSFCYYNKK